MAGLVLFGAAVRALPAVWGFVKAAARVPIVAERIMHEFSPNSGDSLRDKVNLLVEDTGHLRQSNHDIVGQMTASVGITKVVRERIDKHLADDAESFRIILERLDGIDATLEHVKELDQDVKQDLTKFNEIDRLGREGRIDRRDKRDDLAERLDAIHEEIRSLRPDVDPDEAQT